MAIDPLRAKSASWLHAIVMVLSYTSPFWLDWRLVLLGVVLYYIQLWIFGGCVLTFAEFGRWKESFTLHYLTKAGAAIGIQVPQKSTKRLLDTLPYFYVVFSFVWQWVVGFKPLITW